MAVRDLGIRWSDAVSAITDRSLLTLELPAVRGLLAERSSYIPGRELAEHITPTTDLRDAERLQDETAAARALLRAQPSSGIGGAKDIRDALRRARLGGALDPAQLLGVAETVRAAQKLFEDVGPYPPLAALAKFTRPPRALADAIEHAISGNAEVLDRASPRLGSLRSDLRAAQSRLQQRLDGLLKGELARALQEPIVTLRGGRYVVPVKSEMRSAVKGIIHDQSASGATVFIEPLEILEANNALREAELAERAEVQRVLDELSRRVEKEADELDALVSALARLDLALTKAQLADFLDAERPILDGEGGLDLIGARHPLLVAQESAVVPIDVRLGKDFRALVVTGPNTGGKTVTLKTIGLLTLMAACGLQIPAQRGTRVPIVKRIFADIGDEQSIAQSLSTFSSHLRNVVATLAEAEKGDLALLDELGAGTDPDEGAALAMAVLETLLARGVLVAATTHYPELKAFALSTPGVMNASVEFDSETLRPTYRVHVGLPGASNAFAIASRLGLDATVLGRAESHLSELHHSLERTLREAERERTQLAGALDEARIAAEDARRAATDAEREAAKMRDDADRALQRAKTEADELLLQARRALHQAEQARDRAAKRNLVDEARDALADAERTREASRAATPERPRTRVPIQIGSPVLVDGVTDAGTLLSLDDRGMAEVAAGPLRLRVPASSLREASAPDEPLRSTRPTVGGSAPSVPLQLDLRGARAEDALAELDRYLNDAAVAGIDRLRVVHGKGTGALRSAVREMLQRHPLVREHASAAQSEGGDGATIVKL
ncbi:MAG TPA: endonuclease MutS2 [Candidatus Limnocylindrales bacterium]|nr:endonuclease MutS2 [Candidatus Limnocylindrales bacterium]